MTWILQVKSVAVRVISGSSFFDEVQANLPLRLTCYNYPADFFVSIPLILLNSAALLMSAEPTIFGHLN